MKNMRWSLVVMSVALASGCSKVNKVDVQLGELPAGSECQLTPEDPCAGACIGNLCRAPCGSNRECPADFVCVGDGPQSGCIPADAGYVDLLTDCADGCTPALLPFTREGAFYWCHDVQGEMSTRVWPAALAGEKKPERNLKDACANAADRVLLTKDGLLWSETCSGSTEYLGTAGDRVVLNECEQNWQWGFRNTLNLGWLYQDAGETYMLTPYRPLLKFVPESVSNECGSGPSTRGSAPAADACPAPSYPPIRGIPSEFEGFWVECDPIDRGEGIYPGYDADDCATQIWGERNWVWGDSPPEALHVRGDGYGRAFPVPNYHGDECRTAFRYTGEEGERVMQLSRADSELRTFDNQWVLIEQAGETFLRILEKHSNPESGPLMRQIPLPDDVPSDPCNGQKPQLGF